VRGAGGDCQSKVEGNTFILWGLRVGPESVLSPERVFSRIEGWGAACAEGRLRGGTLTGLREGRGAVRSGVCSGARPVHAVPTPLYRQGGEKMVPLGYRGGGGGGITGTFKLGFGGSGKSGRPA